MQQVRGVAALILGALSGISGVGIAVVVALLVLVALFLVPIPKALLDFFLVVNIVGSLILLLIGLFVRQARSLYAFPTVLLLSTLFRLALNVSSTRLILLRGDSGLNAAGQVIEAFGNFVVQGDFVVGGIIFAIIAIVNFVVIAKGSARVAEVSARFTLDALPGKQIAIDSDLRAGMISKEEASERRHALAEESQFFGAMDGAMRFVQGDAIAGFVITLINAIGGVSIGVMRGLDVGAAVDTFGVLTIGDGLVSIIPSLLISVCAGIVVTRSFDDDSRASKTPDLAMLFAQPQAIVIGALVVIAMGFAPGFPLIQFSLVGFGLLAFAGWLIHKGVGAESSATPGAFSPGYPALASGARPRVVDSADQALRLDGPLEVTRPLIIEVSSSVRKMFLEGREPELEQLLLASRRSLYRKRGLLLPEVGIVVNQELAGLGYRVSVRDVATRRGKLEKDAVLAGIGAQVLDMLRSSVIRSTRHPLSQCSASWVQSNAGVEESLKRLGAELLTPLAVLVAEAQGAYLETIVEGFGVDETAAVLETVKNEHPSLYREVFDKGLLSVPECAEVLRELCRQALSIRDIKLILEGVAQHCAGSPAGEERGEWMRDLVSVIRQRLLRGMLSDVAGSGGKIRVISLSLGVQEEFQFAVSMWDHPSQPLPLEPDFEKNLRESLLQFVEPILERGMVPVVFLCPAEIRHGVDVYLSNLLPGHEWFRSVALEELDAGFAIEQVGKLSVQQDRAAGVSA